MPLNQTNTTYPFLNGGGEMGGLIRSIDWAQTPLGTPDTWPTALKITVGMMLTSTFPTLVCWGDKFIQLYNDEFRPINGASKHPQAMGGRACDTYAEIWDTIGPMFDAVMHGQKFGFPDFMVPLDRNGYMEECFFNFSYSPIRDEEGCIQGVLVICIETTAQVRSYREVKIANYELEFAIGAAELGTWDLNPVTNKFIGNARLKEWFGLTGAEEIELNRALDVISEKDRPHVMAAIEQALKYGSGGLYDIEYTISNPTHPVQRYVRARGKVLFNEEGAATRFSGTLQDITVEKTAIDKLKLNKRELEQAFEQVRLSKQAAELGMFDMDLEKDTLVWDERCRLLFGISHNNPVTYEKDFVLGLHPDDRERITHIIDNLFIDQINNGDYDVEYRTIGAENGELRWLRAKGKVLFNDDGRPFRFIGSVLDITRNRAFQQQLHHVNNELAAANKELQITNEELAETQQQLQNTIYEVEKSEARFRNSVQQAPVGIAIFNGRELVIESVNNEMLRFWGKQAGITGTRLADALPELKGQPFLALIDNVFVTGEVYYGNEAFSLLEHNGVLEEGYHNFIYQPIKDETGATTRMMLVAYEVTAQVMAKKAVQKAEQMLRFAIEAANIGTYSLGSKTRKLIASPRLKELFGFYPDEEMPLDIAVAQITNDYREKVISGVEAALNEGKDFFLEYKILGFHDQKLRWVRAVGKVDQQTYKDEAIFSGALFDITEEKADDQRKNDFIGMVSHELKTPLTSLTALIQVLKAKLQRHEDAFISGALDKANIQVRRMNKMINGFLNVSRLESGKILIEKQRIDLGDLVNEVINETAFTAANHAISFTPCGHILVNADYDKISSVCMNLISNAIKYSPGGKEIGLKCEVIGNNACISVKDAGIGINPQDKEKLFERYYRVESNHTRNISGFGIGLYLSAEIVRRHGGSIWVESEMGAGSTFYFSLPLA